MTTRQPAARYTTREVSLRLYLTEVRTRHILLAFGIPFTKSGMSYLWDAAAVDRLVESNQIAAESGGPREGNRGRN